MKAVIVKHENRIRALEARLAAQASSHGDGDEGRDGGDGLGVSQPAVTSGSGEPVNNSHPPAAVSDLGPDEV